MAKIAFVGEAPGAAEALTGKPFCGPSGQLLESMLERVGITSKYVTNVVHCRPPENRTPKRREAKKCGDMFLSRELQIVRPRVIVALGRVAMRYLGIEERGVIVPLQQFDCVGFATYHPAYALRNGNAGRALLLRHLQQIATQIQQDAHLQ